MNNIFLSISCITFNHEEFIRDCLEGFLKQKTKFDYEILIHDDASTDGTQEILREYESKFPEIIKVVYQKKNQFSQGKRGFNAKYNYSRAKGKYIALCEGDDYWSDPLKLQKQVDFLEHNSKYSACFTNAIILEKGSLNISRPFIKSNVPRIYKFKDIVRRGGGFYPTATLVFRNNIRNFPDFIFKTKSGDRALAMLLGDKGNFYYLNEITAVYRLHDGGVFTAIAGDKGKRIEIDFNNLELLENFNTYTNFKYDNEIKKIISNYSQRILVKYSLDHIGKQKDYLLSNLIWVDKLRLLKNRFKKYIR